jgi:hypothetical protein
MPVSSQPRPWLKAYSGGRDGFGDVGPAQQVHGLGTESPRVGAVGTLLALYGFARFVDDIGDEVPPGERMALLDHVDKDLRRLYAGTRPELPLVRALDGLVWRVSRSPSSGC